MIAQVGMGCEYYNSHLSISDKVYRSYICQTYMSDDSDSSLYHMAREIFFVIIPLLVLMVQTLCDSTPFAEEVKSLTASIRARLEKLPNYNSSSATSVEQRRRLVELYRQRLTEDRDDAEAGEDSTGDIHHRTCFIVPVDVQLHGKNYHSLSISISIYIPPK